MTDAKHTPGPWRYHGKSRILGPKGSIGNVFASGITHYERASNAHLIAAAPDMYEALEELERLITDQGFPYEGHMLTTCRVALAKAKGEPT